MAIQFARCEYVSRSQAKNACQKAAYNKRTRIKCERNGNVYSFVHKTDNVHYEVLLPEGASDKYLDASVLANEVERSEKRSNSQLWKEFVLALPDDPQITKEDRIELSRRFAQQYFVDKGVAAQLDIHKPHEGDKNWHTHLLVATRRFTEDGLKLGKKARDLDAVVRKGQVVEAHIWGEIWKDLQNAYFQEKGYDLRVDPIGILPQEHLGPVRMRHHMNDAAERSALLKQANKALAQDPDVILAEVTQTRSVFTRDDVKRLCHHHWDDTPAKELVQQVFQNSDIVPLRCEKSLQTTQLYTTKQIRDEEERELRFATRLAGKQSFFIKQKQLEKVITPSTLDAEQEACVRQIVQNDSNLKLLVGRAGTGKSFTLNHIRQVYEKSGYRVLGSSYTNQVAQDLKEDGFDSKTLHKLLFDIKNGKDELTPKTVLMVDESGMMSHALLQEVLQKAHQAGSKVILAGDPLQLSSVQRGGLFEILCEKLGASYLKTVRRQKQEWQKTFSSLMASKRTEEAAQLLQDNNYLSFQEDKEACLKAMVKQWAEESLTTNTPPYLIARTNEDVDVLNAGVREVRKQRGELGEKDYVIQTKRGQDTFAVGDDVQFMITDNNKDILNGDWGRITSLSERNATLELKSGKTVTFDPRTYQGLRHGYAGTTYKAQGKTLPGVLALHDSHNGFQSAYVAMTRFERYMKVYVPEDSCPDLQSFAEQLLEDRNNAPSLKYLTPGDIKEILHGNASPLKKRFQKVTQALGDRFYMNDTFYDLLELKETSPTRVKKQTSDFILEGVSDEALVSRLITLQRPKFLEETGRNPTAEDVEPMKIKAQNCLPNLRQARCKGTIPLKKVFKLLDKAPDTALSKPPLQQDSQRCVDVPKDIQSVPYLHAAPSQQPRQATMSDIHVEVIQGQQAHSVTKTHQDQNFQYKNKSVQSQKPIIPFGSGWRRTSHADEAEFLERPVTQSQNIFENWTNNASQQETAHTNERDSTINEGTISYEQGIFDEGRIHLPLGTSMEADSKEEFAPNTRNQNPKDMEIYSMQAPVQIKESQDKVSLPFSIPAPTLKSVSTEAVQSQPIETKEQEHIINNIQNENEEKDIGASEGTKEKPAKDHPTLLETLKAARKTFRESRGQKYTPSKDDRDIEFE